MSLGMFFHSVLLVMLGLSATTVYPQEGTRGGYMIDRGHGQLEEHSGDPSGIAATEWQVRLYPRGAPTSGEGYWASISGDSASEVLVRLRTHQRNERVLCRYFNQDCEQERQTYFNPVGPIAVMRPGRSESESFLHELIDGAFEVSEIYSELIEPVLEILSNPSDVQALGAGFGSVLRDYVDALSEVQSQLVQLQALLNRTTTSGLDRLGTDVTRLAEECGGLGNRLLPLFNRIQTQAQPLLQRHFGEIFHSESRFTYPNPSGSAASYALELSVSARDGWISCRWNSVNSGSSGVFSNRYETDLLTGAIDAGNMRILEGNRVHTLGVAISGNAYNVLVPLTTSVSGAYQQSRPPMHVNPVTRVEEGVRFSFSTRRDAERFMTQLRSTIERPQEGRFLLALDRYRRDGLTRLYALYGSGGTGTQDSSAFRQDLRRLRTGATLVDVQQRIARSDGSRALLRGLAWRARLYEPTLAQLEEILEHYASMPFFDAEYQLLSIEQIQADLVRWIRSRFRVR